MPFTLHDSLPLYVPERYDERVHDFITVAGGGSGGAVLATNILRKTIDPTTWIVGNNTLALVAGGMVRIDSLAFRILTTFASAGAPTLDITAHGAPLTGAPFALAALQAGGIIARVPGTANLAMITVNLTADGAGSTGANSVGGMILASGFNPPQIRAAVAVAVYTAGSIEMVCVWAPLSSGATLT